jgi:hypothetical protein
MQGIRFASLEIFFALIPCKDEQRHKNRYFRYIAGRENIDPASETTPSFLEKQKSLSGVVFRSHKEDRDGNI